MAADIPNGGALPWRVENLETSLRDEREARRRAIDKLDEEKADAKDVQVVAAAVNDLRNETRVGIDGLRKLFQWFVALVATGVLILLGIIVQQLSS